MGKKSRYNKKRAAKFHRYCRPGMSGRAFRPQDEAIREDCSDPIPTERVIPIFGAADAGRSAADEAEFLGSAGVQTLGGGFVSKAPKGKKNQGVSTLNDHTKQVPKATPSYRKAGKVTTKRGPKGQAASKDRMLRNVGLRD